MFKEIVFLEINDGCYLQVHDLQWRIKSWGGRVMPGKERNCKVGEDIFILNFNFCHNHYISVMPDMRSKTATSEPRLYRKNTILTRHRAVKATKSHTSRTSLTSDPGAVANNGQTGQPGTTTDSSASEMNTSDKPKLQRQKAQSRKTFKFRKTRKDVRRNKISDHSFWNVLTFLRWSVFPRSSLLLRKATASAPCPPCPTPRPTSSTSSRIPRGRPPPRHNRPGSNPSPDPHFTPSAPSSGESRPIGTKIRRINPRNPVPAPEPKSLSRTSFTTPPLAVMTGWASPPPELLAPSDIGTQLLRKFTQPLNICESSEMKCEKIPFFQGQLWRKWG